MNNIKKIHIYVFIFLLTLLFNTSLHAQTCPNGMIHYWGLDDSTGSTYIDLYGLNATCTNCPSPVTGIINNAQQFSASTVVNVPPDSSFNWLGSFSIEFWMKTDLSSTCSGNQVIIGRVDPSTPVQWWIGCKDGGQAAFYLGDNIGNGAYLTGITDITDGLWHHIIAIRNSSTNELSLYVDGVKENSNIQSFTGNFDSTAEINIGWLNLYTGYHFIGNLDEIAVYNRVLLENEIKSHYYLSSNYCQLCGSPVRIMPLGDSITYGYNDPNIPPGNVVGYRETLYTLMQNNGYYFDFVGQFQNGQFADPDHQGVVINGGFKAQDMANNVYSYLFDKPADIVLLHIGTNDVCNTTASQIEAILNEIDRFDGKITVLLARIIATTNSSLNTCVTNLNNAVESMVSNRKDKIIMVDQEHALTYPDDMYDMLHPNATGYGKMAAKWFEHLQTFLPVCAETQPQIISTPKTEVILGQTYTYDVNATGNPAPTYSLTTAPPGMTIDNATGLIQWTPSNIGTYSVTIAATNSSGQDTQSFTLTVYECPSGMIHYWDLDDNSSPYIDLYGLNATCTNCPTPVTGVINNAQQFSASTVVNAPSDLSFNWSGSFSIEFWMKTDPSSTCSGNQVIIGRDDPTTLLHWWVGCWNGGDSGSKAGFVLMDNNSNIAILNNNNSSAKNITDGNWHHIVAIRNTDTNELSLYVDGTKEASTIQIFTGSFDSTAAINIGWLNLDTGYHFIGAVDEIAVYNRPLTETEIQQHYQGTKYCSSIITHTITATAGSGGSISPSGTVTVNHGANQTFTIMPNNGYQIANVKVDSSLVGPVASYTFTNVISDHTIEATFSLIPTTGTLHGTVSEAIFPNKGIPKAKINTNPSYTTYTNQNGFYQFLDLPSGLYDITASAQRYTPVTVNAVSVPAGGIATQNFELTCDASFNDVPEDHWAVNYIKSMYCREITNGCSTNPLNYCPDNDVPRAVLAVFIIRALGETPSSAAYDAYFDDIANDWLAPYINRLWELNITTGCGPRMFCPNTNVKRGPLAVLIIRALKETPSSAAYNAYFDDIANDWLAPYINRLRELNITTGCGPRMFCPNTNVKRGPLAVFIIRAF